MKKKYPRKIHHVMPGFSHSIFFDENGGIPYSTGRNVYNRLGLGKKIGSTKTVKTIEKMTVPPNIRIIKASSYGGHNLFLTSDHIVYAIGCNENGELGKGFVSYDSKDAEMKLIEYFPKNNIRIVDIFSCYVSFFITDDMKLYCCGKNKCGELGLGDTVSKSIPTRNTFFDGKSTIKDIQFSYVSTLFLLDDGSVWGCGDSSRLGFSGAFRSSRQTLYKTPQKMQLKNIEKISVSYRKHTLLLNKNGDVFGYGSNLNNELGLGSGSLSTNFANTPKKIQISERIVDICAAGESSYFTSKRNVFVCGNCPFVRGKPSLIPFEITHLLPSIPIEMKYCYSHGFFLYKNGEIHGFGEISKIGVGDDKKFGNEFHLLSLKIRVPIFRGESLGKLIFIQVEKETFLDISVKTINM